MPSRSTHRRRPSLLFVFADQLRAADLALAGPGEVSTPCLDRFARDGINFTQTIATTPVCGPSRAALLTGRVPPAAGVPGNDLPLSPGLPTFATAAHAAGLRTGYVGKWHLDGVPRDKFTPPGPRRFGFDDYWAAFNCSHDYFNPKHFRDTPRLIRTPGYEPVIQTDLASEFLQDMPDGDAFCLFLSWGPPHDPYEQVPAEFRSRYDTTKIRLRPNVQPRIDNPLAAGKDCRATTADYYAAITALDAQLGRLLDLLDALGRRNDTLVIFTSDHGDMLWSHGWMKKQLPFEEAIHVPLVARWPGRLPAGVTNEGLFGTEDFLPTISALLGWTTPPAVHGRDRSAQWTGRAHAGGRSLLFANYTDSDEARMQRAPVWRGVRTARFTYTETLGRSPWLLFDNLADPFQQHNLVGRKSHASLEARLAGRLGNLLRHHGDEFDEPDALIRRLGLEQLWRDRNLSLTGRA